MSALPSRRALALILAASLPAQEKNADETLRQAQAKLDKALAQAGAAANGTFTARWDCLDPAGPFAAKTAPAAEMRGKASGRWYDDLLSVDFDGEHELLQSGRRSLVRDGTGPWQLSRDRFADGSPRPFVPDASQLLALLTHIGAKVVRRDPGTLDDRPVETLSVILSGEEAAAAMLAGLLPPVLTNGFVVFGAAAGPPPPAALIDLAFHLDPGLGALLGIDGRIHVSANMQMVGGRVRVMAVAGGAVVQGQPTQEEDDGSEKQTFEEAQKQVPGKFQNGLPVRHLKECTTTRFELRFSRLCSTKAPAVDAAAAALLGR